MVDLYFLLALANRGAKDSMGQDSSSWLVFEFNCLAPRTTFIESPLGIIIKGLRNVVPMVCFSSDEEPFCFIILYFSRSVESLFIPSL